MKIRRIRKHHTDTKENLTIEALYWTNFDHLSNRAKDNFVNHNGNALESIACLDRQNYRLKGYILVGMNQIDDGKNEALTMFHNLTGYEIIEIGFRDLRILVRLINKFKFYLDISAHKPNYIWLNAKSTYHTYLQKLGFIRIENSDIYYFML